MEETWHMHTWCMYSESDVDQRFPLLKKGTQANYRPYAANAAHTHRDTHARTHTHTQSARAPPNFFIAGVVYPRKTPAMGYPTRGLEKRPALITD